MKVKELIKELKKFPPEAEIRYGVKTSKGFLLRTVNKVENNRAWVVMKSDEQ